MGSFGLGDLREAVGPGGREARASSTRTATNDDWRTGPFGRCFLCEDSLNEATDTIYADHDTPESAGGKTEAANLNLVHKHCNEYKRNYSTVNVRPYLKLLTFLKGQNNRVNYGQPVGNLRSSSFGRATSIQGTPRQVELGLRFDS